VSSGSCLVSSRSFSLPLLLSRRCTRGGQAFATPTLSLYLSKLDTENNERFVRIEEKGFSRVVRPVKKFRVACTATRESKGVWKITPQADLEPGEYGLMDNALLFRFGVDPTEKTADSDHSKI
jgi:hypothetical protein